MKKLTIIIPVYNVEKYLSECLKNLLTDQSDSYSLEILLIDDGSTDGSSNLCDQFANKYSYIKALHKNNGGLSSARNYGLKFTKSEWVTFIDSDDVVSPNYLNVLFKLINTKNDIVFFGMNKFYDEKQIKFGFHDFKEDNLKNINHEKAMYEITTDKWGNYAWNKVYRTDLFEDIKYPENKAFEDIYTTYKLIEKSKRVALYDDNLYFYRQRMQSITHVQDLKKKKIYKLDAITAVKKQIDYFKSKNYINATSSANRFLIILVSNYIKFIMVNNLPHDSDYKKNMEIIKNYRSSLSKDGPKLFFKLLMIKRSPRLFYKLIVLKRGNN